MAGRRYYVAVSGYGSGGAGSFTVSGTALAARAQAETAALQVYPNPSNTGQLTLRLTAQHPAGTATLLNALGQPARSQALPTGSLEHGFATTGLAAGVYTLRVQVGKEILTRKVVLN